MALTSWSVANFLRRLSTVVSAMPVVMDGWGLVHTTGGFYTGITIGNTGVDQGLLLYTLNTNVMHVECRGGSTVGADTVNSFSADTWFYMAAYELSLTERRARLNAGSEASNTTDAVSLTAPNSVHIGLTGTSAQDGPWDGGGALGEIALWNPTGWTLTDRGNFNAKRYNGGSAGNGANPLAINAEVGQPWTGALIAYWRLSNTGDLTDLSDNTHDLEMVGTLTNWGGTQPPVDAVPGGGGGSASHILAYKVVS